MISVLTDYTLLEENEPEALPPFQWFFTTTKLDVTPQETLEQKTAMQEQVRLSVIDELGLPVGFTLKELNIPESEWEKIENKRADINRHKLSVSQPAPKKVEAVNYKGKLGKQMMRRNQAELDKAERLRKLQLANAKIRENQLAGFK
jgi:hypothetical protein